MADVEGGPAPLVIYKGANLAKATKLREADEPVFEYPLATTMETMAGALHKSEEPDARDFIRIPMPENPKAGWSIPIPSMDQGDGRGSEHDAAADVRRRDSLPEIRIVLTGRIPRRWRRQRPGGPIVCRVTSRLASASLAATAERVRSLNSAVTAMVAARHARCEPTFT